ncbi:histidine phosphatase family protein [Methylomonas koyamae]|uniref:histidine phosphatase family protein n=1 Tax=Methylomonas koyamae TaxID=702114 RepID=UPI000BC3170E|nr:histidine phosphatase family protein [Methylomonas koyamae]ATG90593.1 phosphoglycerate mutase [Methylomonas koyamae]
MAIVTTVDILRHGEARGGSRYRGVTDDALTERGWRQMYRQCGELHWDVVASSPLRRCRSFAAAWCEQQQAELRVDPAWAEYDFGAWEGLTADRIESEWPGALAAFYRDPERCPPPNAENFGGFNRRVHAAWENLLADCAGKKVLVVSHAGVVRSLFGHCLQLPLDKTFHIEIPQAGLTRFTAFDSEDGRYLQFNFHRPG